MPDKRNIGITDFLTKPQIEHCLRLKMEVADYNLAREISEQVIAHNIEAINVKLGQENDPFFLAYSVCYILQQAMANATIVTDPDTASFSTS